MKTLSEYEAEKRAERKTKEGLANDRIRFLNQLVDEIEVRDIPLYVPKDTMVDRCGYREYRLLIRASVRAGRVDVYNLACDHCGTVLVNDEPGNMTFSDPPKKRISCPGCGWTGWTHYHT